MTFQTIESFTFIELVALDVLDERYWEFLNSCLFSLIFIWKTLFCTLEQFWEILFCLVVLVFFASHWLHVLFAIDSCLSYIYITYNWSNHGLQGVAINFVKSDDIKILRDIEQYYSTQIDEMPMNVADLI